MFFFRFFSIQAIFLLHANRIGHGYHVLQDPELYKLVIEQQIHLEVCAAIHWIVIFSNFAKLAIDRYNLGLCFGY